MELVHTTVVEFEAIHGRRGGVQYFIIIFVENKYRLVGYYLAEKYPLIYINIIFCSRTLTPRFIFAHRKTATC